jgi:hypothetical protein
VRRAPWVQTVVNMTGSSGYMGLPSLFSHRLSFHYPRRRKSIGNPLEFPPSPSPTNELASLNRHWRDSTPDLNRFVLTSGRIQPVGDREAEVNMDSALKARNMRSASSRRKKILEREDSVRREDEAREKRRREIIFGYASDEEQDSDSDGNTYSPIEDKAVEDAEKRSIDAYFGSKPEQLAQSSSKTDVRRLSAQIPPLKINTQGMTVVDVASHESSPNKIPSPLKQEVPTVRVLEAELFNCLYPNRTSTIEDESDVEFDSSEHYSPIEIATPIVFQLPRRRATLISIDSPPSSTPPPTSPKEPTAETLPPPKPQRSAPRRPPSMVTVKRGLAACEAVPFEIPPLPTPPHKINGFDFNLPTAKPASPHLPPQQQPEPITSSATPKRSSSLLSRSKSWRENHLSRRHQPQTPSSPKKETRPQTSLATKSPPPSQTSPSLSDYEFEVLPGFPMPPSNIPTPMSFLTEDPSVHLGLSFASSTQSQPPFRSPPLPPHPQVQALYQPEQHRYEPHALPPTPMSSSPSVHSSRTDSPSPHPSTSTNSSGLGTLLTRKKSLTGLRNRSGSMGKALASRGVKLGLKVSDSVWKAHAPPLPTPPPGSVVRDFASQAAR